MMAGSRTAGGEGGMEGTKVRKPEGSLHIQLGGGATHGVVYSRGISNSTATGNNPRGELFRWT